MKFKLAYYIVYNVFGVIYGIGIALLLPRFFQTSAMALAFSILYFLLFIKYEHKIPDLMLWIDEYLNHRFFSRIVENNYWLWLHTSRAFCKWVCDNFETLE